MDQVEGSFTLDVLLTLPSAHGGLALARPAWDRHIFGASHLSSGPGRISGRAPAHKCYNNTNLNVCFELRLVYDDKGMYSRSTKLSFDTHLTRTQRISDNIEQGIAIAANRNHQRPRSPQAGLAGLRKYSLHG